MGGRDAGRTPRASFRGLVLWCFWPRNRTFPRSARRTERGRHDPGRSKREGCPGRACGVRARSPVPRRRIGRLSPQDPKARSTLSRGACRAASPGHARRSRTRTHRHGTRAGRKRPGARPAPDGRRAPRGSAGGRWRGDLPEHRMTDRRACTARARPDRGWSPGRAGSLSRVVADWPDAPRTTDGSSAPHGAEGP